MRKMNQAPDPKRQGARAAIKMAVWREAHVKALIECRLAGVSIPELLRWIRDDDPSVMPLGGRPESEE